MHKLNHFVRQSLIASRPTTVLDLDDHPSYVFEILLTSTCRHPYRVKNSLTHCLIVDIYYYPYL